VRRYSVRKEAGRYRQPAGGLLCPRYREDSRGRLAAGQNQLRPAKRLQRVRRSQWPAIRTGSRLGAGRDRHRARGCEDAGGGAEKVWRGVPAGTAGLCVVAARKAEAYARARARARETDTAKGPDGWLVTDPGLAQAWLVLSRWGIGNVSSRVRWKAADDGAAAVDELSHEPGDVAADASGDFAEEMAAESAVVPAQGSLGV
jgi:hypothetical protein